MIVKNNYFNIYFFSPLTILDLMTALSDLTKNKTFAPRGKDIEIYGSVMYLHSQEREGL